MKLLKNYKRLSDEDLMVDVCNGVEAAVKELYRRYSNRLLFFFFRMLRGNEEKSQDFLQDIFLKIVEKPHHFNANMNFSTWLFSVASNMCKNEYRRLRVREVVYNESNMDNHSTEAIDHEGNIDSASLEKAIHDELMRMDADRRSTFLLRYQENYSIDEISQIMNCAAGTIKSRLFYTTKELAARLEHFNPH
jgi:RNA polymerase sigma-70 factor (ECF subfamily)